MLIIGLLIDLQYKRVSAVPSYDDGTVLALTEKGEMWGGSTVPYLRATEAGYWRVHAVPSLVSDLTCQDGTVCLFEDGERL